MKIATLLSVALAMGLSVATWTSPASTGAKDPATPRESVIAKCNAQARNHYPGGYRDWGDSRDFAYQRCMFDAGHAQ